MTVAEPQSELGLITRAQAHAGGMTDESIEWRLASGRWQRLHPGVYVTRTGPFGWMTRAAGAVLACGPGAVLAERSAAHLHRLVDEPGHRIEMVIPAERRVVPPPGVQLRRALVVRPLAIPWPPRSTVETTVVDLAVQAAPDEVAALVARSLQGRLTTPERLLAELAQRSRHRQRGLLTDLIGDVRDGHESTLEVRFVRDVLRRHRLPIGAAQFPMGTIDPALSGRRADRGYPEMRVLVELDGVRFHQGAALADDRFKSNRAAAGGWVGLRFGWPETVGRPCRTAADLAGLFWSRGWNGSPRACCAACPVGALARGNWA